MTHTEDVKRVWADSQRMKRAQLLAREAHRQLDAHNAERKKREKPDPDVATYRKKRTDCPTIHRDEEE